jgi:RimJ/RimL family protein N-acetyltransferase
MRAWSALYRSPVVCKHMRGPVLRSAADWWTRITQARDDQTKPLMVELTTTGEFVGACGFLKEQGTTDVWEVYCLFQRKYWNRGFATEATRALLETAFRSLGASRVIGIINHENIASIRMVEHIGFCQAGSYSKPRSWQDGHLLFVFDLSTYNSLLNTDARVPELTR